MADSQSSLKERTRVSIQEPKRYNAILHNDDFTTMEFVVLVLKTVFRQSEEAAQMLMMKVHKEGKAIAGTYSYDIAVSKAMKAKQMAREEGFPLNITVEEA